MARASIHGADAVVFVAEPNDEANRASWAEFEKNVDWAWRVSQNEAPPLVWRTPDMAVFPAIKEALRAVLQRLKASG